MKYYTNSIQSFIVMQDILMFSMMKFVMLKWNIHQNQPVI